MSVSKRLKNARTGPYTRDNPLYGPEYYSGGVVRVNGFEFVVAKKGLAHYSCVNTIKQILIDGEYRRHYQNLNGLTVLDIGAFIGVTAVSFLADGAKYVWAFEPDPQHYKMALENIRRNNVKNVALFNWGVGNGPTMLQENFGREGPIKIFTEPLPSILERLEPDFVKMDCEGCEYETDLSGVREIVLEYHNGHEALTPQFKGFAVSIYPSSDERGIIHAHRR